MLTPLREKLVPIQYVPLTADAGPIRMQSRFLPSGELVIAPYEVISIVRDAYVDVKPRWGACLRNLEYAEALPNPADEEMPPAPPVYEEEATAEVDNSASAEAPTQKRTRKKRKSRKTT